LCHNLSVDSDQRATVKVETSTVTALLIGVEVNPSAFGCGTPDQVNAFIQFPKFVVGSRSVRDNFDPV
jgi:hypothetical protein